MVITQDTEVKYLDSISVGDEITSENGTTYTVFKIDISKFRNVQRYIFRLKGGGTIEINKKGPASLQG